MESRKHIIRTKRYRLHVQRNFKKLETFKEKDDMKGFYKAFLDTIPELRNHLHLKIKNLEREGALLPNFYDANDFIDELFLIVYDSFKTFKDEDDFYIFLFVQLDLLIDRATTKEQEQHDSIESLSTYEKQERDAMIEKVTAQLDGDIILKEELDDISYRKGIQEHMTVYEIETVQRLDQKLDQEKIYDLSSKQVDVLLGDLPARDRNIASLYIHFHLTKPEIVQVTKETKEKVTKVIDHVKTLIQEFIV